MRKNLKLDESGDLKTENYNILNWTANHNQSVQSTIF